MDLIFVLVPKRRVYVVSHLLTLAMERPYMEGTYSHLQWKDACAIGEGLGCLRFFLLIYFQNRLVEHDKTIIPIAMHLLLCRQMAAFNEREIW